VADKCIKGDAIRRADQSPTRLQELGQTGLEAGRGDLEQEFADPDSEDTLIPGLFRTKIDTDEALRPSNPDQRPPTEPPPGGPVGSAPHGSETHLRAVGEDVVREGAVTTLERQLGRFMKVRSVFGLSGGAILLTNGMAALITKSSTSLSLVVVGTGLVLGFVAVFAHLRIVHSEALLGSGSREHVG